MCTRFLCDLAVGLVIHQENTTLKKLRVTGNAIETEGKAALKKAQEVISPGDRVPFFFLECASLSDCVCIQSVVAKRLEHDLVRGIHRSDMDLTRGHSWLDTRACMSAPPPWDKCSIARGDGVS